VAAAPDMRHQQSQRRRRHAIDLAGMADGARLIRRQLLLDLVGQTFQRRIIEIVRQREALVAAIGGDIGGLAREIDVVFGVDLDLRDDLWLKCSELRPDFRKIGDSDIRIGQQLEGAAALAVLIERKPMPLSLLRRQRQRFRKIPRSIERSIFGAVEFRAFLADTADGDALTGQTLVGIIGAQRQALTPRVTRSSIITPR
jgi:hypothetical protein